MQQLKYYKINNLTFDTLISHADLKGGAFVTFDTSRYRAELTYLAYLTNFENSTDDARFGDSMLTWFLALIATVDPTELH